MHLVHEFHQNRKKLRLKAEMDDLIQKSNFSANSKSGKIVQNSRKSRLGVIFDRMDSDNDGLISPENINKGILPLDL